MIRFECCLVHRKVSLYAILILKMLIVILSTMSKIVPKTNVIIDSRCILDLFSSQSFHMQLISENNEQASETSYFSEA